MGSKDAFASLMSNVPGVDTSGFVKRSLNELKSGNKGAKKAGAGAGTGTRAGAVPKDVPAQATINQPGRAPIIGGVHKSQSTSALSSGGESNLRNSNGNLGGAEGVSVESGGMFSGQKVNSGVSDERNQFLDSDLDALGSQGGGFVQPAVPNVGVDFIDPFEDMAGLGELAGNSIPATLVQTNNSGSGGVYNDDLLGLGGDGFSDRIEIKSETCEGNSRGVPEVLEGVSGIEDPGYAVQESSKNHDGLLPGFQDFGVQQEACTDPYQNPVVHGDFVNQSSLPSTDDRRAAKPVLTTANDANDDADDDVDNDWGPDDELSAVVTEGWNAPGQMGKLKVGQKTSQMSSGGKALLARIYRKNKQDEGNKNPKGEGHQGDKKGRFSKYGATFQKKALEYSKKGIGAMKQGIVVATDWVDKQLEDRKRAGAEHKGQDSDMDAIEIAAELEKLPSHDRELVLEQLDPKVRRKVINLFNSQRACTREDDPQSGSPNPTLDDQVQNQFESESRQPSQSQSQSQSYSPEFGDSDPAQHESPRMARPMSIPNLTKSNHMEDCLDPIGTSAPEMGNFPLDSEENGGDGYDFLGINEDEPDQPPPAPATQAVKEPAVADPDDLDAFFGGGSGTTPEPQNHANPPTSSVDDIFAAARPSSQDDLMDVNDFGTGAGGSEYKDLYKESNVGTSDEPEIRKRLREQRIREKHMKMQDALQEKLMKEQEEIEFQETQQNLKLSFGPKIKEWSEGSRGNIRGLLTSLHNVLWEDSGWVQLTVGDVLESSQVKKAYRKANLIVHPDKVQQKNGTEEQTAIADMVFDVLKDAWGLFEQ